MLFGTCIRGSDAPAFLGLIGKDLKRRFCRIDVLGVSRHGLIFSRPCDFYTHGSRYADGDVNEKHDDDYDEARHSEVSEVGECVRQTVMRQWPAKQRKGGAALRAPTGLIGTLRVSNE